VGLTFDLAWPWKKYLKVKKLWPPYLGQMSTYRLENWWDSRKWANNTCKCETWNTSRQMSKYEVICQTPRSYWLVWEVTYVVRRKTLNTVRQMSENMKICLRLTQVKVTEGQNIYEPNEKISTSKLVGWRWQNHVKISNVRPLPGCH